MGSHLYWVSTITYAIVLSIILFSDIKASKNPSRLENSYRLMCIWVLFFCIQDSVWGLCESNVFKNDTIFFISSSVFHISTVLTTFFWLKYVLDYLGDGVRNKRLFLLLDGVVILCELVLVIVNYFETTLFKIVDGRYITGFLRPLTFLNQYIVYLTIGIATLFHIIKKGIEDRSHFKSVFIFTLAPILLGLCQLIFPNGPFYSLGYFLGCFIIHVFVVANDREIYLSKEAKLQRIIELNEKLEKKQVEIDEQFEILKSISGVFDYINLLDFKAGTATRFDKTSSIEESIDIVNDPHTTLNKTTAKNISESDCDRFWEYTNLSTLEERMKNKKLITSEFRSREGDWIRSLYIRIGDDASKPLNQVAYAVRNITNDRKREEQVYSAIANLVYSLHIFDLENDTVERLIESDILKKIVGNEESGQCMANKLMRGTCREEYVDLMLKFVDLSTVTERMVDKKFISCEFVGKFNGWTRMSFIPIEMNGSKVKKIVVTTQIIDSEKNEMINLIYKSSTDELTRLYNRRMYEEELDLITEKNDVEDLVVVAMDVNGLKKANDTLGHKAGDELIIGASDCMRKSFVAVGKVYRTGGDEFMALLRCKKDRLSLALSEFEKEMEGWRGHLVDLSLIHI